MLHRAQHINLSRVGRWHINKVIRLQINILRHVPGFKQSGEIDRMGGISKCGDAMVRTALFEAAQVMLTRTIRWSWLKAWGMKIARHRGMKRAIVAVARRMAVIMHRMWADGSEFRWTNPNAAVT